VRALLRGHPQRWALEAALAATQAVPQGRPLAAREE
jgi:hypothetical protein